MTEAGIKEEFQEHLGKEWVIYLSKLSDDQISIQLYCRGVDIRFKFLLKKRYSAIQMVIRLSRIFQEYDIQGVFELYPQELL